MLALAVASSAIQAQLLNRDLPNSFSFQSVIPYGCLTVVPSVRSGPPDSTFVDQTIAVVDQGGTGLVRVRAWRIGCHEPNASAIILNFALASGSTAIRYPEVKLLTPDLENHPAGLFHFARTGFYLAGGASLTPMTDQTLPTLIDGVSLVVDIDDQTISKQQYNDDVLLQLDWPSGQVTEVDVPRLDAARDTPQFPFPVLNGRYTGQWIVQGLPRQGMTLQIGEMPPQRNFVFLTMFTYLNGEPVWVIGNTDFPIGSHIVTVNMWLLHGGGFFTDPLNSYEREDVLQEKLGTMTLRARHCNVLTAEIDFSESGLGIVSRRFERLIRIAGYDCDQTR